MKHLLLTTIAAVVLVGCGESQQSASAPKTKPEPPTAKAADISIRQAAYDGNIEAVKQAITDGADVNAKNDFGSTPLIAAALEGHKEIVELLTAAGADLISKDEEGVTPLHNAASQGNKEIAQLLIAKGANVNTVDDVGDTPLDFAEDTRAALGFKYILSAKKETADLLRKHGGKTGEELKAEGK